MLRIQTVGYPKRVRDVALRIVQIEHRDATRLVPVGGGFVVLM